MILLFMNIILCTKYLRSTLKAVDSVELNRTYWKNMLENTINFLSFSNKISMSHFIDEQNPISIFFSFCIDISHLFLDEKNHKNLLQHPTLMRKKKDPNLSKGTDPKNLPSKQQKNKIHQTFFSFISSRFSPYGLQTPSSISCISEQCLFYVF